MREIMNDLSTTGPTGQFRWRHDALGAVQEAAEASLVYDFESIFFQASNAREQIDLRNTDTQLLAIHGKRVTLQQRDLKALHRIYKAYNMKPYIDLCSNSGRRGTKRPVTVQSSLKEDQSTLSVLAIPFSIHVC